MTSILSLTVISLIFTGGMQSQANAITLTIDSASAKWTAVSGGTAITGINTDEVRWGIPVSGTSKSGLKFVPIGTPTSVATSTPFELGTLTHFNFPIFVGASGATLGIDMTVTNGNTDSVMFTFDLAIDETTNVQDVINCGTDQQSTTPCDDIITFPGAISSQTVTIDGVIFSLSLLGFGPTSNNLIDKFVTEEFKSSSTKLFAQLESVGLSVDIDIKPASDPNSINPKSNGRVPVAILGSDTFDVTDVDVTTLMFGPSGATPKHDLTDPLVYASHLEDVNNDGLIDLVSHYSQKDAGLASGDTEACITGLLLDGTPIEGCDSVKVK